MGEVFIEKLKVHCIVGLLPVERIQPQDLLIDVVMQCNFSQEIDLDQLVSSPDYAESCELIKAHLLDRQYRTLEALTYGVAQLLLQRWSSVEHVTVSAFKPAAHADALHCGVKTSIDRWSNS